MADSGGEWGKYAFTGVAALFVFGAGAVSAIYGLIKLAVIFAIVGVAVLWFVPWRLDSSRRDRAHRSKITTGESKIIERDMQRGSPWMRVP